MAQVTKAVPHKYVIARTCGHRTRESDTAQAGIEWCEVCRAWVGVIVSRTDGWW